MTENLDFGPDCDFNDCDSAFHFSCFSIGCNGAPAHCGPNCAPAEAGRLVKGGLAVHFTPDEPDGFCES